MTGRTSLRKPLEHLQYFPKCRWIGQPMSITDFDERLGWQAAVGDNLAWTAEPNVLPPPFSNRQSLPDCRKPLTNSTF